MNEASNNSLQCCRRFCIVFVIISRKHHEEEISFNIMCRVSWDPAVTFFQFNLHLLYPFYALGLVGMNASRDKCLLFVKEDSSDSYLE